ncbi:MAG: retroviral-like aspartic protease family protein, partial [Bacteroidaceae bacterium]|nr:retroviral-like aspartic protease family protein [Bacteroidaceae bacterium]
IKLIPVSVNGMSLKMVFDTGSTFTQISIAEAKYLYDKGYLTEDDFVDYSKGRLADGSIVEDMVVRLREVIIDEKITFNDVLATVSDNNDAPLMLGNEILDRTASVEVDNENRVINFKLK